MPVSTVGRNALSNRSTELHERHQSVVSTRVSLQAEDAGKNREWSDTSTHYNNNTYIIEP